MVGIGWHRRNQQRENVAFMAASTPEPCTGACWPPKKVVTRQASSISRHTCNPDCSPCQIGAPNPSIVAQTLESLAADARLTVPVGRKVTSSRYASTEPAAVARLEDGKDFDAATGATDKVSRIFQVVTPSGW
jgi:hypothetical protein